MREHVRRHHPRRQRLSSGERRKAILDAALKLFSEKGFSGARTREIARIAGISEGLIFQHFRNKEELYAEVLDELFSHHPVMTEIEEKMAAKDDAGVLTTLALHIIRHSRQDHRIIRLAILSALEGPGIARTFHDGPGTPGSAKPMPHVLRQYLEQRAEDGAFKDINSAIAARLFIETVDMYVVDQVAAITGSPLPFSDEEVVENLVRIFLDGMRRA